MSTKEKDKTETDETEAGGGKKKLLIIGVVVLLVVGAAAYFLLFSGSAKAAAPTPGAVVKLDPVAVNLAGGGYLRIGVALQLTADARPPRLGVPSELAAELGIRDGMPVRVSQGQGSVVLEASIDPSLAANVLRVSAGHPLTAPLGAMFGPLTLALEREHAGVAASSIG